MRVELAELGGRPDPQLERVALSHGDVASYRADTRVVAGSEYAPRRCHLDWPPVVAAGIAIDTGGRRSEDLRTVSIALIDGSPD